MKTYNQAVADSNRRRTKHGNATRDHGMSKAYRAWCGMKARCNNPSNSAYKDYGGRGIKVCDRWNNSFENFLADMGEPPTPGHTLDRYPDVNKDYSPDNCRWADRKQQANNTRRNLLIQHDGLTLTLSEWADKLGVAYGLLMNRWWRGDRGARLLRKRTHTVRNAPVEFRGESHSLREWAAITGVGYDTIWERRKYGVALFTEEEWTEYKMK